MKRIFLLIAKAFCASITTLLLLSAFVFFYNDSGVHISNPTNATDYTWEPFQRKSTCEEGFALVHMDENGYNNLFLPDSIDILLMGSSQMEAVNVDQKLNTGYLLNEYLYDYNTYNIGVSGHTVYNCVNNIDYAIDTYQPKKYVVMVIDTVELDINQMQSVLNGEWQRIPSYDSGVVYTIQKKLPVAKVLYKKIDDWINMDYRSISTTDNKTDGDDEYSDTLNKFLYSAKTCCDECGVKLIVVYQPSVYIDSDGDFISNTSEKALDTFSVECEEQGIQFVNMTDDFKELYNTENVLPHGFINTAVGVGHLNEYGHKAIAKRVASIIKEES